MCCRAARKLSSDEINSVIGLAAIGAVWLMEDSRAKSRIFVGAWAGALFRVT